MRQFTDTAGTVWNVQLDVPLLVRVQNETGRLLTKLGDDDCALLVELHENFPLTVDILWCLCRDQAAQHGIVDDDESQATEKFAKRLFGDALGDATEALVGASVDFLPNRAQREALLKMLEKINKAQGALTEVIRMRIQELDVEQLVKTYCDSALSSPPSPTSTPTPQA